MLEIEKRVNLPVTRHADVMGRHDRNAKWSEVLIEDGRNRAVWISGVPGTPPDPHIHPDFNEFWVALDGKTRWQIGQYEPVTAEWGDVVMAPAGFSHDIRPWEGDQAIRFGITHPDGNHNIKGIAPCRYIPVDIDQEAPNLIHTSLKKLLARFGTDTTWEQIVVLDERNSAVIVHETPGAENPAVSHPDMNEWWVVLGGRLEFRIGENAPFQAGPGDVVFAARDAPHQMETVGDEPSIRLAITAPEFRSVPA